MKYFIDTEFREEPNTIDLISIGIVAEDGREYYVVSKDFNLRKAWNNEWIRINVLLPIHSELTQELSLYERSAHYNRFMPFTKRTLGRLIKRFGKTDRQIAIEIVDFISNRRDGYIGTSLDKVIESITKADCWNEKYYPREFEYIKTHNTFIPDGIYSSGMDGKGSERNKQIIFNQPEFYGYYADYDWVVFCWLFGRMADLPKGFPMFCMDLKQMLEENALTKEWKRENCPEPEGEHNALLDARWNKKLFEKIMYFKTH